MNKDYETGVLLIISGPTCAGKDTVMRKLLDKNKKMQRLVTTNSRPKRSDEKEGEDYYFVSLEEFEELIAKDAFFEWVEYRGHYRGGQKKHVDEALKSGKDIVWRIDVRGVKNIYDKVKEFYPRSAFIFLTAPLKVLKERIRERGVDSFKEQEWSIRRARWELRQGQSFDYIVENKDRHLKEAVEAVEGIAEAVRRENIK